MLLTENKKFKQASIKIFACLLAVSLFFTAVPSNAFGDVRKADVIMGQTVDSRGLSVSQSPDIDAEYALVMDSEGTVYFERNASTEAQIASITKIMTALVALNVAPLDTKITVSAKAASVGESSASLVEGDSMTLEIALEALLVSSGNDAAIAIAETLGKELLAEQGVANASESEGEQAFVEQMNKTVQELGLSDTVFSNSHGLDYDQYKSDQHSSAADVGIMAKTAMQNDTFRKVAAMKEANISVVRADGSKKTIKLKNTNEMLGVYDGASGIKTGYTELAGASFAGAINRDNIDMFAIVLKSSSLEKRFEDAETLFEWVFTHRIAYPLVHSEQFIEGGTSSDSDENSSVEDAEANEATVDDASLTLPLVAEVAHTDWIDVKVQATVSNPGESITVFDLNGNISQSIEYETITGDIAKGDKVATLTFKQRNTVIATLDLIAGEEVKAPDFFEGIGIWWDRFFRGFSGAPTVAESSLINETPLINDKTIE